MDESTASDECNEYDMESGRTDVRQVAYNRIGRFPTLTFTISGKGLIMTGFRLYEALVDAFKQLQLLTKGQSVYPLT